MPVSWGRLTFAGCEEAVSVWNVVVWRRSVGSAGRCDGVLAHRRFGRVAVLSIAYIGRAPIGLFDILAGTKGR